MDIKKVCFCVLFLSLDLVCCQYSPCPSVFDFESVGGNIYGKIVLQPSVPVSSIILRINFTIAAQLFSVSTFHNYCINYTFIFICPFLYIIILGRRKLSTSHRFFCV